MPPAAGHALRTEQLPAPVRFLPELLRTCNRCSDLRQFGVEAAGLTHYISTLPNPERNDARDVASLRELRNSCLPQKVFNGLAHSLQLFAAAAADAASTASAAAAGVEAATLQVLEHLTGCAWYCVLLIPAPPDPDSSPIVSELTESGERPLRTASLLSLLRCCFSTGAVA
jgi:hypothetical protein